MTLISPAGDGVFWGRIHHGFPASYLDNDSSSFYKDVFKDASKIRLEARTEAGSTKDSFDHDDGEIEEAGGSQIIEVRSL